MNSMPVLATPTMSADRAREIAASFDLRALPADFYANPYPVYAAPREHEPVRRMPDGSYFLTRYADVVAVYRDAQVFSSNKKSSLSPSTAQALRCLSTTPPAWSSTTRRWTNCVSST